MDEQHQAQTTAEERDVSAAQAPFSEEAAPQLPWATRATQSVPSLSAITVTFMLASPEWLQQIILNGGGQCGHNSC